MTYRNAYKELDASGAIDHIINTECNNGANLMLVKNNIIDGIEYYIDFVKSSSFKQMKYWQDTRFVRTEDEKLHHRIVNAVCKALAEIEIANASKYIEQLQYMISVQR